MTDHGDPIIRLNNESAALREQLAAAQAELREVHDIRDRLRGELAVTGRELNRRMQWNTVTGGAQAELEKLCDALRAVGVSPDAASIEEFRRRFDTLNDQLERCEQERDRIRREADRQPAPLPEGWYVDTGEENDGWFTDGKSCAWMSQADDRLWVGEAGYERHYPASLFRALLSLPAPSAPATAPNVARARRLEEFAAAVSKAMEVLNVG